VTAAARRRESKNSSGTPLFRSLIAGCEEAVTNELIGEYMKGKSLTEIFNDSICPAMRLIGELWSKGEITISQEHLATRTAHNSIYKLRNTLPVPKMTSNLAICCVMEGDFHELPAHLAQITLENEGWEVLNFGANTPFQCLAKEIFQHSPKMICISATIITDVEQIARDYKCFVKRIAKHEIPIIFGGRALRNETVRDYFPAEFYAESFADVAEFTQKLTKLI
jgi:methanogenic corrinoid protein MtbC1